MNPNRYGQISWLIEIDSEAYDKLNLLGPALIQDLLLCDRPSGFKQYFVASKE